MVIKGRPPPMEAQSRLYISVNNDLIFLNALPLNAIAVARGREVQKVQDMLLHGRINSNILERMIAVLYSYFVHAGAEPATGEVFYEIGGRYERFAAEYGLRFDTGSMSWETNANWVPV